MDEKKRVKVQCNRLAIMATITEKVKESLVGIEEEPQLSAQIRQEFLSHAHTDEDTGEHYMSEAEFVDLIVPEGIEDFVSPAPFTFPSVHAVHAVQLRGILRFLAVVSMAR